MMMWHAGLEHVHGQRLLHRDIKPANVLLTTGGVAKLGDFGVSRVLSHSLSQARTVIGTPHYLSPEMLEDKGYSFPSDVWSAGVLLYECLTYSHPFQGPNLPAIVLQIMRGNPKPLPARCSADMQYLISLMLHPIPEERPSASECLEARALASETVSRSSGSCETARVPARIRRSFEGRHTFELLVSKQSAASCKESFPLICPLICATEPVTLLQERLA